jgi:hypothetical protein
MQKNMDTLGGAITSIVDSLKDMFKEMWNAVAKKVNAAAAALHMGPIMEEKRILTVEEKAKEVEIQKEIKVQLAEEAAARTPEEEAAFKDAKVQSAARDVASFATNGLVKNGADAAREERTKEALAASANGQTVEEYRAEKQYIAAQSNSVAKGNEAQLAKNAAKANEEELNIRTVISNNDIQTESAIIRAEKLSKASFIDYESVKDSDYSSASTDFDSMRTRAHETFTEAQEQDARMFISSDDMKKPLNSMNIAPRTEKSIPDVMTVNPANKGGDISVATNNSAVANNVSNTTINTVQPMRADSYNTSFNSDQHNQHSSF